MVTPRLLQVISEGLAVFLDIHQPFIVRSEARLVERYEHIFLMVLPGRACPIARPNNEVLVAQHRLAVLGP